MVDWKLQQVAAPQLPGCRGLLVAGCRDNRGGCAVVATAAAAAAAAAVAACAAAAAAVVLCKLYHYRTASLAMGWLIFLGQLPCFFLMRRQQTQALTHEGSDDADSRFGCTGLNRKHMILFWATFVM